MFDKFKGPMQGVLISPNSGALWRWYDVIPGRHDELKVLILMRFPRAIQLRSRATNAVDLVWMSLGGNAIYTERKQRDDDATQDVVHASFRPMMLYQCHKAEIQDGRQL